MWSKSRKVERADIVDVRSYVAIAVEGVSGQRKIPLLQLDVSNRPALTEFFKVHKELSLGDVISTWCANTKEKDRIFLRLEFERPTRISFYISLLLEDHIGVILGVTNARLLYISPASNDDPADISLAFEKSVSIEIGATDFPVPWMRWYQEWAYKAFRTKGLPRDLAKVAAQKIIESQSAFWSSAAEFPAKI